MIVSMVPLYLYTCSSPTLSPYSDAEASKAFWTSHPDTPCCNISLVLLCHVTLSRVESRHTRVFRLFTFPAFLSKTRQYSQDFIFPSNFRHNLDTPPIRKVESGAVKREVRNCAAVERRSEEITKGKRQTKSEPPPLPYSMKEERGTAALHPVKGTVQ